MDGPGRNGCRAAPEAAGPVKQRALRQQELESTVHCEGI